MKAIGLLEVAAGVEALKGECDRLRNGLEAYASPTYWNGRVWIGDDEEHPYDFAASVLTK